MKACTTVFALAALLGSAGCTVGGSNATSTVVDDDNPNAEPPAEGVATVSSILRGSFAPLPGFEAVPIDGRVQLTRFVDGTTQVDLVASGLGANLDHAVHVHALPCAYEGGGHYKMDPAIVDAVDTNEIWPSFTSNEDGIGRASVSVTHVARGDAMSVVIHAPAGGKMACADLLADDAGVYSSTGAIAPLPGVDALDLSIAGAITMTTTGTSTQISMSVSGLLADSDYVSHVHALPCEVQTGGGHYMIDPTAVLIDPIDLEANELWPVIGPHLQGSATVSYSKDHNARADAQSVVIHRIIAVDNKPKVACANLVRATFPAPITGGSAALLDAGSERLSGLTASGEMVRRKDGITVVSVNATGLAAGVSYPVHVHNLPCSVSSGGGHYLIDSSVADTVQDNELWLRLTADANGAADATTFANHVARAEATALVIHDPEDGARLACVDLQ